MCAHPFYVSNVDICHCLYIMSINTRLEFFKMIDEKRLYQVLGERLKYQRENQTFSCEKFTQAKLADEIGLERTSITNIEKGNQKVPLHVLYKICEVLQIQIIDLLPNLSEIKVTELEPHFEELIFAGRTEKVTPLVMQKLNELLNNREDFNG